MISTSDRKKIYQSQQKDVWEFIQGTSGYYWVRTASNGEVVGTSHRAYTERLECELNASMVGYTNNFTIPTGVVWDFYQDAKGEYRWRVTDKQGVVINRSHEGYKSALAAEKNAVRHGYQFIATSTQAACTQDWSDCTYTDCAKPANWIVYVVSLFMFVLVILAFDTSHSVVVQVGPTGSVEYPVTFSDVPLDHPNAACVYKLAVQNVLTGYKDSTGALTGEYGFNHSVSRSQLAKVALVATDNSLFSCAPVSQEPTGNNWAEPYIRCAVAKQWRTYPSAGRTYTDEASKVDAIATIIDAFELTEQQAADSGLLGVLDAFTPQERITRNELAQLICAAEEASARL
jgi:uncharacterized protein YegP (UPF0339 family)